MTIDLAVPIRRVMELSEIAVVLGYDEGWAAERAWRGAIEIGSRVLAFPVGSLVGLAGEGGRNLMAAFS